jgi:phage I-like protein
MQEKIIDLATGKETLRPYTAAEIAAVEAEQTKGKTLADAEAQKAAEKTAVLTKLGLTAEEAAALLS